MTKLMKTLAVSAGIMAAAVGTVSVAEAATGTYSIKAGAYDDAVCVDTVVVKLDQAVSAVSAADLAVSENAMTFSYVTFQNEMTTTDRVITDAYLCDESGAKVEGASEYICVTLKAAPGVGKVLESAMVGTQSLNVWAQNYSMNIGLAEGAVLASEAGDVDALEIDPAYTALAFDSKLEAFDYEKEFMASDGTNYRYATFTPAEESSTLVVWLHGLGEGGTENTDPRVILAAAEASALAGEEFQAAVGGAHILVPQCPTWWMDPDGSGQALDGEADSFYLDSLYELIQAYKAEIGAEKVVIAGCSNGGYMTMQMIIRNPEDYVAAVPICEAFQAPASMWVGIETPVESGAEIIVESVAEVPAGDDEAAAAFKAKLESIKDVPMFFIYSKDDPLVIPGMYEIPTINYLTEIGASNLKVYASDVVNMDYEDGEDHFTFGHASWVYFFNNTTGETPVWNWIGEVLGA